MMPFVAEWEKVASKPGPLAQTLKAEAIERRRRLGLAPRLSLVNRERIKPRALPQPTVSQPQKTEIVAGEIEAVLAQTDATPVEEQLRLFAVDSLTREELMAGIENRLSNRRFMKAHLYAMVKVVAAHFSVSYPAILSHSRHTPVVSARFVCIYALMITYSHMSYSWCGRLMGRDHSTLLSAVRRVRGNFDFYEEAIRKALRAIEDFDVPK